MVDNFFGTLLITTKSAQAGVRVHAALLLAKTRGLLSSRSIFSKLLLLTLLVDLYGCQSTLDPQVQASTLNARVQELATHPNAPTTTQEPAHRLLITHVADFHYEADTRLKLFIASVPHSTNKCTLLFGRSRNPQENQALLEGYRHAQMYRQLLQPHFNQINMQFDPRVPPGEMQLVAGNS